MENYFQMNFDTRQVNAVSNLGLAHTGDVLQQNMPLRQNGRQNPQQHLILADHNTAHLIQNPLGKSGYHAIFCLHKNRLLIPYLHSLYS